MWSYVAVGIVCFAAGALFIWVMPKSRRVRMNMTVEQIINKTFHWTGHKRFEFTGWYDAKDEESGVIWAENERAATEVLLRTYFHVQLRLTPHKPIEESDRIVY